MSQVKKATAASHYLSEELLMEIMKRLPVKYVLRCRCVRKSWDHLVRSPYFISLHASHQNSLNKYLLFLDRYYEKYFSLRFDDEQCKEYCKIRFPPDMQQGLKSKGPIDYETCNGVMCLSAFRAKEVYLWNPALRVFDVLPDSPIPTDDSFDKTFTIGLAFGYLAKTNDYKIIKYEKYHGDTGPEGFVYVYSLSTDSWKTVKKGKFGEFSYNKLSDSVVVSGVAYWVGCKYELGESEKVIVCFDMENDTIREIMLPPPYSKKNAKSFVLVGNSLFGKLLSLFYYDRPTYVLHIWVLENAGGPNEVWMKKKSLSFEPIWRPMAAFRNNGELVVRGNSNFLSYDSEKNEAKDIVDDDSLDVFYRYGEIYPDPHRGINRFEETLVLLDVKDKLRSVDCHKEVVQAWKHDKCVKV